MIAIDIETSADYDINDDRYIKTADVKWVGIYDFTTDKYHLLPYTEKNQIIKLIKEKGDVIVTFNGNAFDLPILKNNHYLNNTRFTHIDLIEVFKKHNGMMKKKLIRFSMAHIAKELLGLKKGDLDYEIFKKSEWSDEELVIIQKYLRQDLNITKQLFEYVDEELKPLKEYLSLYDQNHYKYLTISPGSYVYSVICNATGMRKDFENDVVHEKYEGGLVINPAGERFVGNIYMMDFSSMYPHAYMMGNLFSNNCSCCLEENKWGANELFPDLKGRYCSTTMGKIEGVVKKFYNLRLQYKKVGDPREYAMKIIINTMYGVCGNPVFKNLYNPITAADCTYMGRRCIQFAREVFEEAGYKIIYSDTDSVYLIDVFNDENRLFERRDFIVKRVKDNVSFPQETFSMVVDDKPKAIFFIPTGDHFLKKNYVYVTENDELVIKGLKVIKSNGSKLSKLLINKYLTPRIIKSLNLKFDKLDIRKWLLEELHLNIDLAGYDMNVKDPKFYKNEGQLQRQVALKYGKGVHFLIPNYKYGVGKGVKLCKKEELVSKSVTIKDIDLRIVYKELAPFMIGNLSSGIIRSNYRGKEVLQNTLELWV